MAFVVAVFFIASTCRDALPGAVVGGILAVLATGDAWAFVIVLLSGTILGGHVTAVVWLALYERLPPSMGRLRGSRGLRVGPSRGQVLLGMLPGTVAAIALVLVYVALDDWVWFNVTVASTLIVAWLMLLLIDLLGDRKGRASRG